VTPIKAGNAFTTRTTNHVVIYLLVTFGGGWNSRTGGESEGDYQSPSESPRTLDEDLGG